MNNCLPFRWGFRLWVRLFAVSLEISSSRTIRPHPPPAPPLALVVSPVGWPRSRGGGPTFPANKRNHRRNLQRNSKQLFEIRPRTKSSTKQQTVVQNQTKNEIFNETANNYSKLDQERNLQRNSKLWDQKNPRGKKDLEKKKHGQI